MVIQLVNIYDILILPKFFGDMVILAEIFGDIVITRPLLAGGPNCKGGCNYWGGWVIF